MTILFYAYVFGPEWEDIHYFVDLDTALARMKRDYQNYGDVFYREFHPIVVSYKTRDTLRSL